MCASKSAKSALLIHPNHVSQKSYARNKKANKISNNTNHTIKKKPKTKTSKLTKKFTNCQPTKALHLMGCAKGSRGFAA